MPDSDYQLLTQYRRGETSALEELINRYRRPLFSYILNMTGGQEGAEDIFQEVWLRVMRRAGQYRQKNFFGWIVRIAHNLIVDRARRARPEISLDNETEDGVSPADAIPASGPDPAGETQASELGRRIARAAAALPPDQKEVFLLRVQANMPFREIAAVQRVPLGTALARMQYALAKLRETLRNDYEAIVSGGAPAQKDKNSQSGRAGQGKGRPK